MTFTDEQKRWFEDNRVDSGVRLTWDDDVQTVWAKDMDGFHPTYGLSYVLVNLELRRMEVKI